PADLIVLTGFTLSNIRLLLLSQIGQAYDPQSRSGTVGRNFTYQLGGASATGWNDDRILNRFMGFRCEWLLHRRIQVRQFRCTRGWVSSEAETSLATTPALDQCRTMVRYRLARRPGAAVGRRRSSTTITESCRSACRGECPAYRQNYA